MTELSRSDPAIAPASGPWSRPGYRGWFLTLLLCAYALNFLDRQLLSILAEPVKQELGLSDAELGLLGGVYFALFYAGLGVPIARLSDRTNRVRMIAGAIALWSLATAACGLATKFWHLAIARIAVATGESAATPPSYSLLADLYPIDKRSAAIGLFTSGTAIGAAAGLALGGWVGEAWGWRAAFFVIGLPGLLLSTLILSTLREPPRGYSDARAQAAEPVGILDVARVLFRSRTFPCIAFGVGTASICGYALAFWMPSFLIRSFGMTMGEAGWRVALAAGLGGFLGGAFGGKVCDMLAPRDRRWWLWAPAFAFAINTPLMLWLFNAGSSLLALVLLAVVQFNYHFWGGSGHAMVQSLVGQRMRSVAASMFLLVINLVGLGLGPIVVGLISDAATARYGEESLRFALLVTAPIFLLAAALFVYGATRLRQDLDNAPD